jgi:hypothetical protein
MPEKTGAFVNDRAAHTTAQFVAIWIIDLSPSP